MIKFLSLLCALTISQIIITSAWPYDEQAMRLENAETSFGNLEKITRIKRYNKQYQDIINIVRDFSLEVNNLATAIETQKNYFNYIQKNGNANIYVDNLRSLSKEIKALTTSNYDIQSLTANLRNSIKKLKNVPNEMGDVSLQNYPGFNGGSALKSLGNNIETLSIIIEKLGTELLEAENKSQTLNEKQNEVNKLKKQLANSGSTINNLNVKITELQTNLADALKFEKSRTNQFESQLESEKLRAQDLEKKLADANDQISYFKRNEVKMKQEKATMDTTIQNLQQELDKVNITKGALLKEREEHLKKTNLEIDNLEKKLRDFNNKIENLQKERSVLIKDLNNTSAATLQEEITRLEEENRKNQEIIKEIQKQSQSGMPDLVVKVLKDKIEELTSLLENNNKAINEKEAKLNNDLKIKEDRIIELERELTDTKLEKDEIEKQLTKLNESRKELEKIIMQFKSLDPDVFFKIVMEKYRNQINDLNAEIVTLLGTICPK